MIQPAQVSKSCSVTLPSELGKLGLAGVSFSRELPLHDLYQWGPENPQMWTFPPWSSLSGFWVTYCGPPPKVAPVCRLPVAMMEAEEVMGRIQVGFLL